MFKPKSEEISDQKGFSDEVILLNFFPFLWQIKLQSHIKYLDLVACLVVRL